MITNQNLFHKSKTLPVDKFFEKALYDKNNGYYSTKLPFGGTGDFLTAPGISSLFSEMIGIWLVSTWKNLGEPKKINIVELGPGNGNLTKILIKVFRNFPEFNKAVNMFLYEKSKLLRNLQKKNIKNTKIKWVKNFKNISGGPVIFFGNEFYDAIPIKQFFRKNKFIYEKYYSLNKKNKIVEIYKKASVNNIVNIKKYKTIRKLNFIEFPKLGLEELNKIVKKISQLNGGILLIDYGYLKSLNKDTLQSVKHHKKNKLLDNIGDADITSLVNFELLNEYFIKNKLKVKNIVTQKFFLKRMGILERANIISKKMSFSEKTDLYLRLKRLLDIKLMGELFKVIFAYKFKNDNFVGFK